jgi:hypothetical protein
VGLPGAPGAAARPVVPQELVLLPAQPLKPRTQYRVEIHGVQNINGLPNGGGSVTFLTRPPLRQDTTGMRTDSSRVRRDTIFSRFRRP